jgi:hypothetical protein
MDIYSCSRSALQQCAGTVCGLFPTPTPSTQAATCPKYHSEPVVDAAETCRSVMHHSWGVQQLWHTSCDASQTSVCLQHEQRAESSRGTCLVLCTRVNGCLAACSQSFELDLEQNITDWGSLDKVSRPSPPPRASPTKHNTHTHTHRPPSWPARPPLVRTCRSAPTLWATTRLLCATTPLPASGCSCP